MEESIIPSLSSGIVGSRFISQDEVDTAKARRDEQWKAAYARLGQEPPPQQQEDSYDGRSLAEKLAANRAAKQEEWEEKTKLANQFRALEEDEIMFLDSLRERQENEEKQRKEKDGEEVKSFKEAVAARASNSNLPPQIGAKPPTNPASKQVAPPPPKKELKKSLKGVIVKKKAKPAMAAKASTTKETTSIPHPDEDPEAEPTAKRRKIT